MKDINLLNDLHHSQKQFNMGKSGKVAAILIALLAIILGCVYCHLQYLNSMYSENIHKIESEMLLYNDISELKNDITSGIRQIEEIHQLLDRASEASYVTTTLFNQISSAMGDSIFLTSLVISDIGTVSITGKAVSRSDITHLTYALKKNNKLSDIHISSISQDTQIPDAYNFSASAAIRGAEYLG